MTAPILVAAPVVAATSAATEPAATNQAAGPASAGDVATRFDDLVHAATEHDASAVDERAAAAAGDTAKKGGSAADDPASGESHDRKGSADTSLIQATTDTSTIAMVLGAHQVTKPDEGTSGALAAKATPVANTRSVAGVSATAKGAPEPLSVAATTKAVVVSASDSKNVAPRPTAGPALSGKSQPAATADVKGKPAVTEPGAAQPVDVPAKGQGGDQRGASSHPSAATEPTVPAEAPVRHDAASTTPRSDGAPAGPLSVEAATSTTPSSPTTVPTNGEHQLPGVSSQLLSILSPPRPSLLGGATVSIALHPESLGEVRVSMTVNDAQTIVHLTATTPEGATALRASADDLRQDLSSDGHQASVFVTDGNAGNSAQGSDQHAAQSWREASAPATSTQDPTNEETDPTSANVTSSSRLIDMRL